LFGVPERAKVLLVPALVKEGEMELRQWMSRRRDPWRRSPFERFVFLWLVPILVILMLSFFAAAHP
jgi:hypothetical protein